MEGGDAGGMYKALFENIGAGSEKLGMKFTDQNGKLLPMLDIRAGERVGLIGGIGSGKSTLLRLMAGLYAPHRGIVTLDGLDVSQIAESVLRRDVGYLPQDFRLVNGTLRENLLMGLSDPGDAAVMEAARATGLIHVIAAHPLGLDLPIAEGGIGLSGGQRTLTGLTRLLLAEPSLLLLDEPTSNLDITTEQIVLGALGSRLSTGQTLVLVTHKLSLLNLVDRVIVLQAGRVTHDGPTEDVLKALTSTGTAELKPASQVAAEEAAAAQPAAAPRPAGPRLGSGITAGGNKFGFGGV